MPNADFRLKWARSAAAAQLSACLLCGRGVDCINPDHIPLESLRNVRGKGRRNRRPKATVLRAFPFISESDTLTASARRIHTRSPFVMFHGKDRPEGSQSEWENAPLISPGKILLHQP